MENDILPMENGILPNRIIAKVIAEENGLDFGCVSLNIFLRDGKPRWEISRSISITNDAIYEGIGIADCLKRTDKEGSRGGYGL